MICVTCEDYEFVPDGEGMLERCPDCSIECPVHGGRFRLVCPSCKGEAADARIWMRRNCERVPVVA